MLFCACFARACQHGKDQEGAQDVQRDTLTHLGHMCAGLRRSTRRPSHERVRGLCTYNVLYVYQLSRLSVRSGGEHGHADAPGARHVRGRCCEI